MSSALRASAFAAALAAGAPQIVLAQHAPHADSSARPHVFSTALPPRAEPFHGLRTRLGGAEVVLHSNVQLQYFDVPSSRPPSEGVPPERARRREFGALNWGMAAARVHALQTNAELQIMMSAEAWTLPQCGYPLSLGGGALCGRTFVTNRQHAHDLVSALALRLDRPLARGIAVEAYGAVVGEPALGPVSYSHRASGGGDVTAPASFHTLDSEHSAPGVLTAGLFGRRWKVEASVFNGRGPDEHHADIELAALDSRSVRLWLLPSDRWAAQLSAGRILDPEHIQHTGGAGIVRRTTASVSHYAPLHAGALAATLAYGLDRDDTQRSSAVVAEAAYTTGPNAVFARVESLRRPDQTTVTGTHDGGTHEFQVFRTFRVHSAALGYRRDFRMHKWLVTSLGARLGVDLVPADLAPNYDTRRPVTGGIFIRVLPHAPTAH